MNSFRFFILMCAFTYLHLVLLCSAEIIVVESDGSGDKPTIQAAINTASNGDEIVLSIGTYTGNGNRDIDFLGKTITVRSIDPDDSNIVETTVINCQYAGRGFYFGSGEGLSSVVSGLTIKNGLNSSGGGIYCNNSSPMIKNCIITENVAKSRLMAKGGGIYCSGGEPTLLNCKITQNSISAQNWREGCAIHCTQSSPLIKDCLVSDNFGSYQSIDATYDSELTIIGCTINGNSGNISTRSNSSLKIEDSVISGNTGGGVYIHSFSSADIKNCIIANNTTSSNACPGLLFGWESSFLVTNCTIFGNTSLSGDAPAGGLCYNGNSSSGSVLNSIIWGNWGDEIAPWYPDPTTIINVDYSNIEEGYNGEGNIDIDPLFVNPTEGNYHLLSGSLCIDAGDPASGVGDEPLGNGGLINMGAYGGTFQASLTDVCTGPVAGDINNDCTVDFVDFAMLAGNWLVSTVEE